MKKILVIEDDARLRENVLELVVEEGFEGIEAVDGESGVRQALSAEPDLVICDVTMPGMSGFQVLEALRSNPATADVPFIFLSARVGRSDVRGGMSLGADDYLTKPFTRVELLDTILARLQRHEGLRERIGGDATRPSEPPKSPVSMRLAQVIIKSPRMEALYDEAVRAARSSLSILILGETGVGKDVLAAQIHRSSPRAGAPFLPLNCAALSETLLESELFGHEKGAFTGAGGSQPGLIETADGGTVFLDEAGEIAPSIQVKLLRVLEDRVVTRVGGRIPKGIDVRFIAATNRDLEHDVASGSFRRDLYFRINGITLDIPPLRERVSEIQPLAESFVAHAAIEMERAEPPRLRDDALQALHRHPWPGNVRELKNAMERAVALCSGGEIAPEHLPPSVFDADPSELGAHPVLKRELKVLERQRVAAVLEECGGNQTAAAKRLGVSRRTLVNRLDEFDLPRPRKK